MQRCCTASVYFSRGGNKNNPCDNAVMQKECQPNKKRNNISEATIHFNSDISKSILSFFIKSDTNSAIYETRNTETGERNAVMRGTRGMFTRIPGNLPENSGECCFLLFRGMLKKIPRNDRKDTGECSRRFRGI